MATEPPTTDDPEKLRERIADLEAETQQLRNKLDSHPSTTRRRALKAGGLLAGGSLLPVVAGSVSAQPSGTIPASGDPAFVKFRGDRVRLLPRVDSLSNPGDGVVTYRPATSAIPDSVISRSDDDGTTTETRDHKRGHEIQPNETYDAVAARISNNTSGVTTGYLFEVDSNNNTTQIDSVDISGKSSGDAFKFDTTIQKDDNYIIAVNAETSDFTTGFSNTNNVPVTGSEIDIVENIDDADSYGTSSFPQGVNDIGNPDNIL